MNHLRTELSHFGRKPLIKAMNLKNQKFHPPPRGMLQTSSEESKYVKSCGIKFLTKIQNDLDDIPSHFF